MRFAEDAGESPAGLMDRVWSVLCSVYVRIARVGCWETEKVERSLFLNRKYNIILNPQKLCYK